MIPYRICWECLGQWYANTAAGDKREPAPVRGDTIAIVGEEFCEGHPE